jgi:MFS family permease
VSHLHAQLTVADAGYISCIFPSNLLLRKVGPRGQFGFALVAFGAFVCLFIISRGYGALLGLRFLVGASEALLQAAPLYMVVWYGRDELGKRIGKSALHCSRFTDLIDQLSFILPLPSRASSLAS